MEDAPVQVAVGDGTNDGVLLGLGDVHLPTEWKPVSGGGSSEGRKPLLAPRTFKTTLPRRQKLFMGLLGKGYLADPGLRRCLTIRFRDACGGNASWHKAREGWQSPLPSALEGLLTAGTALG